MGSVLSPTCHSLPPEGDPGTETHGGRASYPMLCVDGAITKGNDRIWNKMSDLMAQQGRTQLLLSRTEGQGLEIREQGGTGPRRVKTWRDRPVPETWACPSLVSWGPVSVKFLLRTKDGANTNDLTYNSSMWVISLVSAQLPGPIASETKQANKQKQTHLKKFCYKTFHLM